VKGTITKYRKKDGRVSWGYYYKAGEEQFTKSGFATKDAAVDARDFAIREAQGLPPVGHAARPDASPERKGDTRTLREYLTYWLETHAALRCTPKTMERYSDLSAYLARQLGSIRLCDLKTAQIQDAVNRLKTRGGAITKAHPHGRPLAAKTVRSIATLLYTCLGDAARLEHIPMNPMGDKRIKLPKRPKTNPAVLDAAMLGAVFQAAEGRRLYPFVVTAGCSGCRRGELLALRWADVDFQKGVLTISKSLEQTRAGQRVKCTKSEEPRRIGVDDFALEVLAAHRENQEQDKLNFGHDYQDNGLVFCQPNGAYYSPDRVGARVKEVLQKAGLSGFSLHSLRHSHASVLLGEGVPIAVVSERLGHADQNITLGIYSHSLPTDVKAASKVWRNALADVISEDRSRKNAKNLGKSRKLAVND
jgi:integrase